MVTLKFPTHVIESGFPSRHIQVNWDIILHSPPSKFCVHPTLNRHVGILRLFPSISTELVVNYLKPPMAGVILQTYGMGNAPDNRGKLVGGRWF